MEGIKIILIAVAMLACAYMVLRLMLPIVTLWRVHDVQIAGARTTQTVQLMNAETERIRAQAELTRARVIKAGGKGDYARETFVDFDGRAYIAAINEYAPRESIAHTYSPRITITGQQQPALLGAGAGGVQSDAAVLPDYMEFIPRYDQLVRTGSIPTGHVYFGDTVVGGIIVPITAPWAMLYHLIAGGRSGMGKSTLGKILSYQIAANGNTPVQFALLDPDEKERYGYGQLPQLYLQAYDGEAVNAAVDVLFGEMKRRFADYARTGAMGSTTTFTVVDEMQTVRRVLDKKGKEQIDEIARKGRQARIYIVAGAQRPTSDGIGADARMNFTTGACFAGTPADVARSFGFYDGAAVRGIAEIPGRALYKLPFVRDAKVPQTGLMQTPRLEDDDLVRLMKALPVQAAPYTARRAGDFVQPTAPAKPAVHVFASESAKKVYSACTSEEKTVRKLASETGLAVSTVGDAVKYLKNNDLIDTEHRRTSTGR